MIGADLVTEALARRASPAGRWSCWTWPCPATSIPAVAAAAGRHWSAWTRSGTGPRRRGAPELAALATRDADVEAVRAIVAEEFAARVSAVHAARVAPTVVALRTKAAKVVDAELARLAGRCPPTPHAR